MRDTPNYNHLYRFWIVAQEGSLIGASRRLGVRHSTLSSQLRTLEDSLGVKLLLRRPRGVRLTPQGEAVAGYCDQMFRLGAELVDATADSGLRYLRVGMPPSVPRSLFYEALRPILESEKKPRIQITIGQGETLSRELVAGRLHVVVSDRMPTRGPGVHAYLVSETRVSLYGTRRLAQRHASGFPRSLDRAPLLLPLSGTPLREALESWFAEAGVRPRIIGEFDDVPLMLGFAERGHGLVPIRQALAREARQRYGLVQVGAVAGLTDRIYALTLGRRMHHPGLQAMIERWRGRLG